MKNLVVVISILAFGTAAFARGGPRDNCKVLISKLASHYSASCTGDLSHHYSDVTQNLLTDHGISLSFDTQTDDGILNLITLNIQPDPEDKSLTNISITCTANAIKISYDKASAGHTEQSLQILDKNGLSLVNTTIGSQNNASTSCQMLAY